MRYDAIVLAGGEASRLGGMDKAEIVIDGRHLIDRVLDAVRDADAIVVVGPQRTTEAPVSWAREIPPGAGPTAALAAGLAGVSAEIVVVLAVDLPRVDESVVGRLLTALEPPADGALAVDGEDRDQPLLAVYRADRLRAVLEEMGQLEGAALRDLVGRLHLVRIDEAEAARDCDTWEDLEVLRAEGARDG